MDGYGHRTQEVRREISRRIRASQQSPTSKTTSKECESPQRPVSGGSDRENLTPSPLKNSVSPTKNSASFERRPWKNGDTTADKTSVLYSYPLNNRRRTLSAHRLNSISSPVPESNDLGMEKQYNIRKTRRRRSLGSPAKGTRTSSTSETGKNERRSPSATRPNQSFRGAHDSVSPTDIRRMGMNVTAHGLEADISSSYHEKTCSAARKLRKQRESGEMSAYDRDQERLRQQSRETWKVEVHLPSQEVIINTLKARARESLSSESFSTTNKRPSPEIDAENSVSAARADKYKLLNDWKPIEDFVRSNAGQESMKKGSANLVPERISAMRTPPRVSPEEAFYTPMNQLNQWKAKEFLKTESPSVAPVDATLLQTSFSTSSLYATPTKQEESMHDQSQSNLSALHASFKQSEADLERSFAETHDTFVQLDEKLKRSQNALLAGATQFFDEDRKKSLISALKEGSPQKVSEWRSPNKPLSAMVPFNPDSRQTLATGSLAEFEQRYRAEQTRLSYPIGNSKKENLVSLHTELASASNVNVEHIQNAQQDVGASITSLAAKASSATAHINFSNGIHFAENVLDKLEKTLGESTRAIKQEQDQQQGPTSEVGSNMTASSGSIPQSLLSETNAVAALNADLDRMELDENSGNMFGIRPTVSEGRIYSNKSRYEDSSTEVDIQVRARSSSVSNRRIISPRRNRSIETGTLRRSEQASSSAVQAESIDRKSNGAEREKKEMNACRKKRLRLLNALFDAHVELQKLVDRLVDIITPIVRDDHHSISMRSRLLELLMGVRMYAQEVVKWGSQVKELRSRHRSTVPPKEEFEREFRRMRSQYHTGCRQVDQWAKDLRELCGVAPNAQSIPSTSTSYSERWVAHMPVEKEKEMDGSVDDVSSLDQNRTIHVPPAPDSSRLSMHLSSFNDSSLNNTSGRRLSRGPLKIGRVAQYGQKDAEDSKREELRRQYDEKRKLAEELNNSFSRQLNVSTEKQLNESVEKQIEAYDLYVNKAAALLSEQSEGYEERIATIETVSAKDISPSERQIEEMHGPSSIDSMTDALAVLSLSTTQNKDKEQQTTDRLKERYSTSTAVQVSPVEEPNFSSFPYRKTGTAVFSRPFEEDSSTATESPVKYSASGESSGAYSADSHRAVFLKEHGMLYEGSSPTRPAIVSKLDLSAVGEESDESEVKKGLQAFSPPGARHVSEPIRSQLQDAFHGVVITNSAPANPNFYEEQERIAHKGSQSEREEYSEEDSTVNVSTASELNKESDLPTSPIRELHLNERDSEADDGSIVVDAQKEELSSLSTTRSAVLEAESSSGERKSPTVLVPDVFDSLASSLPEVQTTSRNSVTSAAQSELDQSFITADEFGADERQWLTEDEEKQTEGGESDDSSTHTEEAEVSGLDQTLALESASSVTTVEKIATDEESTPRVLDGEIVSEKYEEKEERLEEVVSEKYEEEEECLEDVVSSSLSSREGDGKVDVDFSEPSSRSEQWSEESTQKEETAVIDTPVSAVDKETCDESEADRQVKEVVPEIGETESVNIPEEKESLEVVPSATGFGNVEASSEVGQLESVVVEEENHVRGDAREVSRDIFSLSLNESDNFFHLDHVKGASEVVESGLKPAAETAGVEEKVLDETDETEGIVEVQGEDEDQARIVEEENVNASHPSNHNADTTPRRSVSPRGRRRSASPLSPKVTDVSFPGASPRLALLQHHEHLADTASSKVVDALIHEESASIVAGRLSATVAQSPPLIPKDPFSSVQDDSLYGEDLFFTHPTKPKNRVSLGSLEEDSQKEHVDLSLSFHDSTPQVPLNADDVLDDEITAVLKKGDHREHVPERNIDTPRPFLYEEKTDEQLNKDESYVNDLPLSGSTKAKDLQPTISLPPPIWSRQSAQVIVSKYIEEILNIVSRRGSLKSLPDFCDLWEDFDSVSEEVEAIREMLWDSVVEVAEDMTSRKRLTGGALREELVKTMERMLPAPEGVTIVNQKFEGGTPTRVSQPSRMTRNEREAMSVVFEIFESQTRDDLRELQEMHKKNVQKSADKIADRLTDSALEELLGEDKILEGVLRILHLGKAKKRSKSNKKTGSRELSNEEAEEPPVTPENKNNIHTQPVRPIQVDTGKLASPTHTSKNVPIPIPQVQTQTQPVEKPEKSAAQSNTPSSPPAKTTLRKDSKEKLDGEQKAPQVLPAKKDSKEKVNSKERAKEGAGGKKIPEAENVEEDLTEFEKVGATARPAIAKMKKAVQVSPNKKDSKEKLEKVNSKERAKEGVTKKIPEADNVEEDLTEFEKVGNARPAVAKKKTQKQSGDAMEQMKRRGENRRKQSADSSVERSTYIDPIKMKGNGLTSVYFPSPTPTPRINIHNNHRNNNPPANNKSPEKKPNSGSSD